MVMADATEPSRCFLSGPREALPYLESFKNSKKKVPPVSDATKASSENPFFQMLASSLPPSASDALSVGFMATDAPCLMGRTMNGSATYIASGNPCLDFFFHIQKDTDPKVVCRRLEKAWEHDPLLALKLVFQLRAVRGTGKSDRESFYVAAAWLYEHHPRTLIANLRSLPTVGCFKDLLWIVLLSLEGQDAMAARHAQRQEWKARKAVKFRKPFDVYKAALRKKDGKCHQRQDEMQRQWWEEVVKCAEQEGGKDLYATSLRLQGSRSAWEKEWKEKRAPELLARNLEAMKLEKEAAASVRRKKRGELAARVLVAYQQDEIVRDLHNAVADVFGAVLRSDLEAVARFQQRSQAREEAKIGDTEMEEEEEEEKRPEKRSKKEGKGKWLGKKGPLLSLAAKWAPSLDLSFDRSTLLAEAIARRLFPREGREMYEGMTDAQYAYAVREKYRKEVLVPLRKMLEVPEVYMSAQRWGEIPYGRVPSVCMKNNKDRFQAKDGVRFWEYLADVKAGKAKIASGALLPHDIVAAAKEEEVTGVEVGVAELQWRSMVEEMRKLGGLANAVAVCDTSGSMCGTPMEVAVALSLLVSELTGEPWRNHIISFSQSPQMHRLKGETLAQRAAFTESMDWGFNTNFQAVFDGILQRAVEHQLPTKDMVQRLYVFSDMEFDSANDGADWTTDHEKVLKKFHDAGYEPPEIVYWNLSQHDCSSSTPVIHTREGAALVSGFSKNMLKVFMEGGKITPEDVMLMAVAGKEYEELVVVD